MIGSREPQRRSEKHSIQEDPTREEMWSVERLEEHARWLAQHACSAPTLVRVNLPTRLKDNAKRLESAYLTVTAALRAGRAITPASEWLVDNYHVLAEQVTDIPLKLTPKVWQDLPRESSGDNWPRIFHLVREYLAHTDYNFDTETFSRYLLSYQCVTPLTMRELWALYPVLRIVLIDELRRVAVRMEAALIERGDADIFANTLLLTSPKEYSHQAFSDLARRSSDKRRPYIVQLAQRLQFMGEERQPVLDQLVQHLTSIGTTIDEVIQHEHMRRSASNLTVRNIMTSLREAAAFDWRTQFERVSLVEQLLREHSSYYQCDRLTRDRYRNCIQELAKLSNLSEILATQKLLTQLSAESKTHPDSQIDIGEFLIGSRRSTTEKLLGFNPTQAQSFKRWVLQYGRALYFGCVLGITTAVVGFAMYWGVSSTLDFAGIALCLMAFFPASEFAIAVINRIWMRRFAPRHMPRLALQQGLSPELKTLVVMPVILRSIRDGWLYSRQLQVHALANPDSEVRYALLTDFADAKSATTVDDTAIVAAATEAIASLNRQDRQPPEREPRFYLLHRRRQWNEHEQAHMGWERKRGKLFELNKLLLGAENTSFVGAAGSTLAVPKNIRYVFTVDADTRIPLGAVRDLVGVAAHPLNRPVFDRGEQRIVRGFGVLQPRITPLLPTREERSLYREIITGGSGLDPYAAAVSDLYQDVFGEGLFTGKGLYEVAAFEAALKDRVPENALLSHDLFEGIFARCALVTDIELFEEFPSHSEVAAARSHRWMRGDWQLLPWILGVRGKLPPLARWKMLDNLRRSLLAPAAVFILVAAWSSPNTRFETWIILVVLPIIWPALATLVARLTIWRPTQSAYNHLRQLSADFVDDSARTIVAVGLLAQNAWLSIDAIGRALFRLTISHHRMLEWTTAAQLNERRDHSLSSFIWPLKGATIVVVATCAIIMRFNSPAITEAAPLLILWWLSPLLARFLSRPLYPQEHDVTPSATAEGEMRGIARLTWRYFETFVTAEDSWLPPDNFQEEPLPTIAHRSSPTNIGLYLLSCVAAHDFGWLGTSNLALRLHSTISAIGQLQRFNGHLLNWYDTRTLKPLAPLYVSTVDSGNLAGHLIALRQALNQATEKPLLAINAHTGILDSVRQCTTALSALPHPTPNSNVAKVEINFYLSELRQILAAPTASLSMAAKQLYAALEIAEKLLDMTHAFTANGGLQHAAVFTWVQLIHKDISSHLVELDILCPKIPHEMSALLATQWNRIEIRLAHTASLVDVIKHHKQTLAEFRALNTDSWSAAECEGQRQLLANIERAHQAGSALLGQLRDLSEECWQLVDSMQFGFLYDRHRGLFSIGFRIADHTLDTGYYDLLASESRLTSFVAIAKGDVPRSHWRRLGRRLTGGSKRPVLASWSGSMFEYLMPALVMKEPRFSLLEQTNSRAVTQQIQFGVEHSLPWGISESAYNVRDRELTYQYSAFGLATLGLKRGLGADYVAAPYATALAAMLAPASAIQNFHALDSWAGRGEYGYYEAIDFTTQRVPDQKKGVVIRCYMAHHQGMTIVALDNALNDRIMQSRFHRDPMICAAELLLQERAIRFADAPIVIETELPNAESELQLPALERTVIGVGLPTPVTHLLSNRLYAVMLTDSGAGYSVCRSRAVSRWREDPTRDAWGSFIYIRDVESGKYWSSGFQPTAVVPDHYEVVYKEEAVEFRRRDGSLSTLTEVVVAAEDNGELRRVSIRNDGAGSRIVDLTSYAEIVLAPHRADVAHPSFSNLFVQTEFAEDFGALIATRRRRSSTDEPIWAVHVLSTSSSGAHLEYETDRLRFMGRGRNVRSPLVIEDGRALSNTVGNVLDPIFSLRTRITIEPEETVTVTFATLIAESREMAIALASKYRHPAIFAHACAFAWTFVRAELHYLQSDLVEARLFQILAANLLFPDRRLRTGTDIIASNRLNMTHLWRFSISGDRPILLIRCRGNEELDFIKQCLRAQEYLRIKRLFVDLVILNELQHSYVQDLQNDIERTVRAYTVRASITTGDERGDVYTLRTDLITPAERVLILATARVVLHPAHGSLTEQLRRPDNEKQQAERLFTPIPRIRDLLPETIGSRSTPGREFFNGLGGFAREGREYVIVLEPGTTTPAPWCNVIANEEFGTLVSESGAMCTWSLNSHENLLTPWSNDAVSDPSGEAIYIHDADSNSLWSPTPLPIRLHNRRYEIRHGQGYSQFLLNTQEITSDLKVFIAPDDPVKLCRLRLTNNSHRNRRLTLATYVEWTLGPERAASAPNIVTEIDPESGAMFARNSTQIDFGTRVAFCDLAGRHYVTGSRREFLGRGGDLSAPAGMHDVAAWSGRVGAGLDPCCAMAIKLEIAPGASEEILILLGQASDTAAARLLVSRHRINPNETLRQVGELWDGLLGTVQIRTPDRALDVLFNRWLLYQTVSCRLWARAAFYQAGGAYGFRDQLQDCMSLSLSAPARTREHLLRAAARQFLEGDVQHWWHPPSGRGVRTHFSDDRLWLPFAVHQYLEVTGDIAVLDELIPFIEGPPLAADKEDAHYVPMISAEVASMYEHCARAIDVSMQVGVHGLPLMGGGDWNDGMNRVGYQGRGESVWLAWFLIANLRQFAPIATLRGDADRARRWLALADAVTQACELQGWDGAWYRRAYFDDGSPLGSAANAECRIDSIAQSWAVLSKAADAERAARAMDSFDQHLLRGGDGLALLFTPPFDTSNVDPGYIKGYLPGVRENGGQYTHAALWALMAHASLKNHAQVGAMLDILNPIRRADTRTGVQAYRVEPYVIAGDIYSTPPHTRRGGWTWYTGAAGWFYTAILESVLGAQIRGASICLVPCMPPHWNGFEVIIKTTDLDYRIQIERVKTAEEAYVLLDGHSCSAEKIPLVKDGRQHWVKMTVT